MSWLGIIENALGFIVHNKDVAIYKGTEEVLTGNILFNVAIIKANVNVRSDMPEHPIESGAKIVDHKIMLPTEIDVDIAMPAYYYASVYRELKKLYEDSEKLSIKTKMSWYYNMVLQNMPHEENAEHIDRVIFTLHFKEVVEIEPKYIKLPPKKVANAENSSTQKLGTNVTNATKKQSIAYKGYEALKGLFK